MLAHLEEERDHKLTEIISTFQAYARGCIARKSVKFYSFVVFVLFDSNKKFVDCREPMLSELTGYYLINMVERRTQTKDR